MFPDNRGRHMSERGKKNRQRIIAFFKANPGALQRECADALDLNLTTVEKHIRKIRDESKKGASNEDGCDQK